jgi:hypothetical protein
VQGLLQCGPVDGRHRAAEVSLAAAVVVACEMAGLRGGGLLPLEDRGLAGVGLVGRDDLEQVLPELVGGPGVVVARLREQVRLGLGDQVRIDVVGELLDPPDHHAGLLGHDLTGSQRVAGQRVGDEVVAEPDGAVRGRPGRLGGVGQPVRCGPGADLGAEVEVVGVRGDPGLELDQPGLGSLQRDQGLCGLVRIHRPDRGVSDGVELGVDVRGRNTDPEAGRGDRCHGSSQAGTTDVEGQNPCIHRVLTISKVRSWRRSRCLRDRRQCAFLNHRSRLAALVEIHQPEVSIRSLALAARPPCAGKQRRPEARRTPFAACRRPARANPQHKLIHPEAGPRYARYSTSDGNGPTAAPRACGQ